MQIKPQVWLNEWQLQPYLFHFSTDQKSGQTAEGEGWAAAGCHLVTLQLVNVVRNQDVCVCVGGEIDTRFSLQMQKDTLQVRVGSTHPASVCPPGRVQPGRTLRTRRLKLTWLQPAAEKKGEAKSAYVPAPGRRQRAEQLRNPAVNNNENEGLR